MPEYTRFEVYLPTYYTATEQDPESHETTEVVYAADPQLVRGFHSATLAAFHGMTASNEAHGAQLVVQ